MGLAVRIRQGIADGLVFLLSIQLIHLLVDTVLILAASPSAWRGLLPPQLLQLAVSAFALVCSVYLTEDDLRSVRLLRSYPPRRLIPLTLHFVGLLAGLVIALAKVRPVGS